MRSWRATQQGRYISIAVIAVLLCGFIAGKPAITRQLNAWKLLPQPERLTELYFTDHTQLPSTYAPGQTQTVRFTVHNLEYRQTKYHYQVLAQNTTDGSAQLLSDGSFDLNQDQYQRQVLHISPGDVGIQGKIIVKLVGQNESIDYHIKKEGA